MIDVLAAVVLLTLGGFGGVAAGRGLVWWDSYRRHTRDTLPSFDPPPPEAYRDRP